MTESFSLEKLIKKVAGWCNGNTDGSGPSVPGSSPGPAVDIFLKFYG